MTTELTTQSYAASANNYTGAGQAIVVIDSGFSYNYDQSDVVYSYDFNGNYSGGNDRDASTAGSYSHGDWVAEVARQTATGVLIQAI